MVFVWPSRKTSYLYLMYVSIASCMVSKQFVGWITCLNSYMLQNSYYRFSMCRKPPSYVPYKGTYVPYNGTFGAPDQGQTLDVWGDIQQMSTRRCQWHSLPDMVRCDTCEQARPLSQVWGVEPNTSSPQWRTVCRTEEDCMQDWAGLHAGLSIPT